MEFQAVKKEIEAGRFAPLYFFFGDEMFLIDQLVQMVVKQGVDSATKDFNYDLLDAEQTDGATVFALASSYPMMSDRRVVVVKSIQKFSTTDKTRILDYVLKPLETTCLVLTAGKVDRRQKFYASLIQHSQWVDCRQLYENQAIDWVKTYLRQSGKSISHEAATLMVQQVGSSLWNLYNEIEKMMTHSWGEIQFGMAHIHSVVGFSRQHNSWEFVDAVGRKDYKRSMILLANLLEEGQSPAGLIVVLCRRVLLLMQIREMLDKGMNPSRVASTMGLRPYFANLYLNQAKFYSIQELQSAMKILLDADRSIKTGYLEPLMTLTLTIHRMIRGGLEKRLL